MLVALPQPPLVGLSVDGDEVFADLAEHTHRRRAATDVGPGPALGRHRPHQHQAIADVGAGLGGPHGGGVVAGHVDDALDHGAACTGPHETGVGPRTEEQPQAGDDHGLAGAGLTGDDVEPGVQLEHGVVDDAEPLDPQFGQHGAQPLTHGRRRRSGWR